MSGAAGSGPFERLRGHWRRLGRAMFGDRRGLALFLGTVSFVAIYWRAGVFITDTETLVVTLDAVAEGHLWIDRVSDSHFQAPGAVVADGLVYGRNYGQVLLSLPILWALEALESLADLRVGLTALWHLTAFAFVLQVGRLVDSRRLASIVGGTLVTGSFLLNLLLATSFADVSRPLLALQLGSIVATGLLATVTYRLVARRDGTGVGLVVGGATALVLPIGFWASLPKRHITVALLLVCLLYSFARSRGSDRYVDLPILGEAPAFRTLAYGFVGLLAWVHAAEAVFVLIALVVVDVPTAPSNDGRTLVALTLGLGLALLPTFLTNVAISGQPWGAPRMLTPADVHTVSSEGTDFGSRLGGGASTGNPVLDFASRFAFAIGGQALDGVFATLEPNRFVQTWIRSGSPEFLEGGLPEFAGSNLAVLESVPVFGAFAGLLAVAVARLPRPRDTLARVEPTDALAVTLTIAFVLLYAARLPVHVQITVRYLLPVFPVLAYLLVRLGFVRQLLTDHQALVGWAYAAAVLVGTQLVLALVVLQSLTVSAAVQTHALLGLGAASLLALAVLATHVDERAEPAAALALGLAGAAGTAFILISGMAYFSFIGEHVLPVADAVSQLIGRI